MTRFKTVPYAAGLAAMLMLSGCQGGSPDPTPSTTSTSQVTTSASSPATTTATAPPTTTAGPTFPPGLPAAAKAHTKAGAKAFVGHYIDQWNRAWTTPDPELLRPLCDVKASEGCATAITDAEEYLSRKWHYNTTPLTVRSMTSLAPQSGRERVALVGTQNAARVVDRQGKPHESYRQEDVRAMFYVAWTGTGWRVVDLRPL